MIHWVLRVKACSGINQCWLHLINTSLRCWRFGSQYLLWKAKLFKHWMLATALIFVTLRFSFLFSFWRRANLRPFTVLNKSIDYLCPLCFLFQLTCMMANEWTYWISEQKGRSMFAAVSQHSPCVSLRAGQVQSEGICPGWVPGEVCGEMSSTGGEAAFVLLIWAPGSRAAGWILPTSLTRRAGAGVAADAGSSVQGVRDGRDGVAAPPASPAHESCYSYCKQPAHSSGARLYCSSCSRPNYYCYFFKKNPNSASYLPASGNHFISLSNSLTLQNKCSVFFSLPLVLISVLFCCLRSKYRVEESGPEDRMAHPNGAHCHFIFHCWAQAESLHLQSLLHMQWLYFPLIYW